MGGPAHARETSVAPTEDTSLVLSGGFAPRSPPTGFRLR
jgi:hypothetical protein